jgi:hypothetical protein
MISKKILGTFALSALLAFAGPAQADTSGVWTGVDVGPSSYYVYLGGLTALSGQDVNAQSGWLARADVGYGNYDYDTTGVAGGNVDADVKAASAMVGYRHFFTKGSLTVYLGGNYANHDQSPRDAANSVEGSKGGVKGALELQADLAEKVSLDIGGHYSTAFQSYWTRATVGYNFGPVTVGPEVRLLGNEEFHQFRAGVAASAIDLGFANGMVYAGYAESSSRGDDGAYGGIGLSKNF